MARKVAQKVAQRQQEKGSHCCKPFERPDT
jgi:hypothetical protein